MSRVQKIFKLTGVLQNEEEALRSSNNLPDAVKDFVKLLLVQSSKSEDQLLPRKELQKSLKAVGQPSTDYTIKSRMDDLINAGSAMERRGTLEGKTAIFIEISNIHKLDNYYLKKSLEGFDAPNFQRRSNSEYNKQLSFFAPDPWYLQNSRSDVGYGEGLMQIVDSAMPLDTKDIRKEIVVDYPIGHPSKKEVVRVKARTLRDPGSSQKEKGAPKGGIMVQTDKRAVNSIALLIIERAEDHGIDFDALNRGESSDEEFAKAFALMNAEYTFDIYNLAEEMGFSVKGGAGPDEARQIISRIRETVFDLDFGRSQSTKDRFAYVLDKHTGHENPLRRPSGMMEFRFFTTFRCIDDYDKDPNDPSKTIYAPRWYGIRLHPEYLTSLLKGRFIAHKSLNKERNATAHKIAAWCRSIIGVSAGDRNKDVPRSYRIDELWARTLPNTLLGNFNRDFINFLKRDCISPDGFDPKKKCLSRSYGYYFEYDPDQDRSRELRRKRNMLKYKGRKEYPVITISRDPEDPINGNNSIHNKKLRIEENRARQHKTIAAQPSTPDLADNQPSDGSSLCLWDEYADGTIIDQ